ncbi:MAG: neutral zinc metallopeptidase [Planctomycetes bacterium]|nr:neutral zinc metallopeptidase [Planctomycetota bacterium]
MRWERARRSENVEDRRGARPRRGAALGGGGLLVVVLALVFGIDPGMLRGLGSDGGAATGDETQYRASPEEQQLADFVSHVLGDTEDVWGGLLPQQAGVAYRNPTLVLFTDSVDSACGVQGAAVGPFYCPGDSKLYIDLSFYRLLRERLGADGDFAQAYVIAHEVGHHVQNLLGTSRRVHEQQRQRGEAAANDLSVRLELQADFYAGVWAHHASRRGLLETGDIEEALNAAAAIGDDTLQRRAGGRVRPESFTHGTSEQRARWFRRGLETGDLRQGDTFAAERL